MITGLREDIYTLVNASAGAGGLHYVQAKQGATFPFTVFTAFASPVTKDTMNSYYEYYVQFMTFGSTNTAEETEVIAHAIITALDESEVSFSVAGYTVVSIDNVTAPRSTRDEGGRWQTRIEFRIRLTKG